MILSVFGSNPPPGAYGVFDDNPPSIRLAQQFCRYGALLPNGQLVGARLYLPQIPVGATGVRFMVWLSNQPITTTPDQISDVALSATGWVEGAFLPVALPPDDIPFKVGYQFTGPDGPVAARNYVYTAGLRVGPVPVLADPENGIGITAALSSFSDGGGPETPSNGYNAGYGLDILVDDNAEPPVPNVPPVADAGVDQSTITGQQVTLLGTGTDEDGTIISYAWQQVSGPSVVLGGSGATRTFTPATAGLRTFRLTVTDNDGATASDTVSITTLTPEPPDPGGSDEEPASAADQLNAALVLFAGCIGSSFDDICTYGLISGDSYVPFNPDPEDEDDNENCDDYGCGQVWVRIESINAITPDSWETGCSVTFSIELEVGIIRCFEIPAEGEAPTASEMLGYAMQSNEDMNRIFCSAMGCEEVEDEFDKITAGAWLPLGPIGGQYGGTWSFTVLTA